MHHHVQLDSSVNVAKVMGYPWTKNLRFIQYAAVKTKSFTSLNVKKLQNLQGENGRKSLASGVKRTSGSVKLSLHSTEGMLGELNFRSRLENSNSVIDPEDRKLRHSGRKKEVA